jgi:hypothetical protein
MVGCCLYSTWSPEAEDLPDSGKKAQDSLDGIAG